MYKKLENHKYKQSVHTILRLECINIHFHYHDDLLVQSNREQDFVHSRWFKIRDAFPRCICHLFIT